MKRTKPQIQVNEGKEQRASSIIMVAADSYLSKERKKVTDRILYFTVSSVFIQTSQQRNRFSMRNLNPG
jgi:hypothetical protein